MSDGHDEIRERVRDHYAAAARGVADGTAAASFEPATDQDAYGAGHYPAEDRELLPIEAVTASLGCGNPLAVADLNEGDTVLDLGSGGGIDVLLSARRVGPTGHAYGLDMTDEMLDLARSNAAKAQAANVEFLKGTIEAIPLPDGSVDVVISNCVIDLSPDKAAVFAESYRVLKPGGRIGFTDVIADADLSPQERAALDQTTECLGGALTTAEFQAGLVRAGFVEIEITRTGAVSCGLESAIVRARKPAAPEGVTIRPMHILDGAQVLAIYQHGLDTGDASFEIAAPSWADFDQAKLPDHRYVAADTTTGDVLGWIAASLVSDRCVYQGVVEHSVYVHPGVQNHGIGSALLHAFIASTEAAGIWTVQSGIFPENAASLRLHHQAGFRTIGTRERLGQHHGRWRDVVFIERRSITTGTGQQDR